MTQPTHQNLISQSNFLVRLVKSPKVTENGVLWALIYLICILFLLLFIILQWNNRINTFDDFYFLQRLHNLGFFSSIASWHSNQRPVGHFFFNLTFCLNERVETYRWSLLAANLLFLVLFTHSIKIILSKLLIKTGIHFENKKEWSIAFLLVICSFFFAFERCEIWFWYICFVIYLLPLLFLNYACCLIFEKGKIHWFSLWFFFLIGGCLELIIFISALLLLLFFVNRKISLRTLLLNGLALSVLSIFQFFNHGIVNRIHLELKDSMNHHSTFSSVFSHLFEPKNLFFVLLAIILIAVFHPFVKQFRTINFYKIFLNLIILLTGLFFVTWLIGAIVFSGSWGELRMWAPFSLFLMVFILLGLLFFSSKINRNIQLSGIFSALLFIAIFGIFANRQVKLTTNYAHKYDNFVRNGGDAKKFIDSGVLISPGDFKYVKEYLNLPAYEYKPTGAPLIHQDQVKPNESIRKTCSIRCL